MMTIPQTVSAQREYFSSGVTLDLDFRRRMLKALDASVDKWENALYEALQTDLHKSREEAYMTEISIVKGEIKACLGNLGKWASRKRCPTPLSCFPSRSYTVTEPLGSVLILSPWNYPVQLALNPLIGAIAAGCTAVLKLSPLAPSVSAVLSQMLSECFEPEYVAVFQGHRDVNEALFEERFDLIFLTGSPALGKVAMSAAAKNLTPVILELGGKSPCVIDKGADLALAARRVAWGKILNAGQTCIAPDYILVQRDLKDAFVREFRSAVSALLGVHPEESPYYGRIVSDRAFQRIVSYLSEGEVLAGGHYDENTRFMEPTLLGDVSLDSVVMQNEIFGPVFPVLVYDDLGDVEGFVNSRPKPLALYYFGEERTGWEFVRRTSSGGACINDTIMHIANPALPFGGVGNSGMGHYHGKESFLAFSHTRSVLCSPRRFDVPFRYMPYRLFGLVKKLLG